MLQRLFPHPVLSLVVAVVWLMLANDLSPGHVLLAIAFGVAVPKLTAAYWPDRPPLRRPAMVLEYCLVVLWDIIVSNIQVAYLVLFRRGDSLRSRYITVPLDITVPEAIATLAGTITMTPGTVSADLSADGRALLVHCLDTDDPEGTVAQIKQRYERRLKEIFS
ncbi:Na+/H+ antiporter subunit E [Crenalkalicoccus roseus]|uniref:Na+/H+ antiporter subunit E n=1 Tax=Crenalkalicoccus roseus TaxID=1485588 RepID=UPI0010801948|nr:Na+/H+ antiporter subunit E [Crenalkalicoccus roseus]